jgi:small subunit ribosomal protein S9
MSENYVASVGRRKEASARAKLVAGKGEYTINGKPAKDYFGNEILVKVSLSPLEILSKGDKYDIFVKVSGGGKNGQADAIRHAISRALVKEDESVKSTLRKAGYITRDPRAKERKKPGLKRARKAPQFSKR